MRSDYSDFVFAKIAEEIIAFEHTRVEAKICFELLPVLNPSIYTKPVFDEA